MRLLNTTTRRLQTFPGDNMPPYAILSHTWGRDEVSYQDLIKMHEQPDQASTVTAKEGYTKIEGFCKIALSDGYEWGWVDTCCIDKSSTAELSESINSMFRWYSNSSRCYVYLNDVLSGEDVENAESRFRRSRWFTRGWTLQELLAPSSVKFYDQHYLPLGDKKDLKHQIYDITGIAETALLGAPILNFRVCERYDWARSRETTLEEDWAYSLQGIFGVFLPPIYGERRLGAVRRLVTGIKETLLGDGIHSFIIDNDGRGRIVNPLFLDIALLQTMSLFDEAREEVQHYRSNLHNNAISLSINDAIISDAVSTFVKILYGLSRYVFMPLSSLVTLDRQRDLTSAVLRDVIASNGRIALDLQRDQENGQETLNKLETAQDFLQGQRSISTQATNARYSVSEELKVLKQYMGLATIEIKEVESEAQETNTEEAKTTLQPKEEVAVLRERVERLEDECRQWRHAVNVKVEQMKAQEAKTKERNIEIQERHEEVERKRREYENKNAWQKIWAWIVWLGSWGSGD